MLLGSRIRGNDGEGCEPSSALFLRCIRNYLAELARSTIRCQSLAPLPLRTGGPFGVAGVAAVVGGIYLLSIDGKCAARIPDGSVCKERFSNLGPGIPMLVLGAGAVAVSAVWLWRDAHTDVALAVSPGGAALVGRF